MHRYMTLIASIVVIIFTFTSCYDANEIDEQTYVLAIGVDKGACDRWKLSVQLPLMKSGTGGDKNSGEGGASEYDTITIEAPSFFTGINMINTNIGRRLNFMHTKYLVFSKGVAEDGMIGEFLAPITRYREIRRTIEVVVSRCTAVEFLKENKPLIGKSIAKDEELLSSESENTGFFPRSDLAQLYNGIKSTYRQAITVLGSINKNENYETQNQCKKKKEDVSGGEYVAGELLRIGGSKVELFGTAVFDGDNMIDELNGTETRLMLIAQGEFKRGFFTIKDPRMHDLIIPLDVRQSRKPQVKVHFKDGIPVIDLRVQLEGDILAVQSRINYEKSDMKTVLEDAFKQEIKQGIDSLVHKTQNLGTDILQLGRTVVRSFGTIQEWEEYNWIEKYKKAIVNTKVEFIIRRTGTFLKSSPIITTKGKE